jgi:hypothetical protein
MEVIEKDEEADDSIEVKKSNWAKLWRKDVKPQKKIAATPEDRWINEEAY